MHLKTFYSSVRRVEYTLAESDLKAMALVKARSCLWGPVPDGMREQIDVEIHYDEDKGTRIIVTRRFEQVHEEPQAVDAGT